MFFYKNTLLTYLYSKEVTYRLFYIFFSFSLCFFISFFNIEHLLLFETYPFSKFSKKKFIVTNTTELINTIFSLVTSTSLSAVAPLFFYQLYQFSKPSWYRYQFHFFINLLTSSFFIFYFSLLFCYFVILPCFIEFLIQWEMKNYNSILSIEVEFKILNYISWTLEFRYFFCLLNFYFLLLIVNALTFISSFKIYNLIKLYRKQIAFLNILFLFFIFPSDLLTQFFIIFSIVIFYESFFFFLCFKTQSKLILLKCRLLNNY